jgi:GT2 family glycosyltransferase/Tfp pilus assembly protein PilF
LSVAAVIAQDPAAECNLYPIRPHVARSLLATQRTAWLKIDLRSGGALPLVVSDMAAARRRNESRMDVSVVIPCFNGAELTRACVGSLLAQTGDGAPAEILLVDNGSSDDTATLGALSPCVRVLRQERNLGFAGGVNQGLRAAKRDFVLVLNNDTQAADNLLRELHDVLVGHPRMGAVAPCSNHVKGDALLPVGDAGKSASGRAAIQEALRASPPLQDATTLAGLCLLFRRPLLDDVGLFDERFGHGNFEDDDFCLRVRLRGHRLGIAGRAFLHHEGHATFRSMGLDLGQELQKRRAQFRAKWQDDPAGRAHLAALDSDAPAAADAAIEAALAYPAWPDADWHRAVGALLQQDAKTAVAHLRAFLRQCPMHANARMLLAQALGLGGDATAARMELHRALDCALSHGQQLRVLLRLGEDCYRAGAYDDAKRYFESLHTLSPEDPEALHWRGLCELALDRVDAAAALFEQALVGGLPVAQTNLGICRARQGRIAEARACFERAMVLMPQDPAARANLAACDRLMQSG